MEREERVREHDKVCAHAKHRARAILGPIGNHACAGTVTVS